MFGRKSKERIAELEAGIARLFKHVYEIEGVLRPGSFFDFSQTDDLVILNRWLNMIEKAQETKAFETKVKNIVEKECPKKKGAK